MTPAPRGFRLDIQGLRAIAVGVVVLYHAGTPLLTGGYVGVDIFFVISGFLITGHLLAQLDAKSRISFADFYARRARRILPASFVVLIATVVASLIWIPPLQLQSMLRGAIATALYVPNYYFAVIGTSYLSDTTPSLFQHYWSLGVEEQFYLLWPALLAVAFVAFRRSRRALFVTVCVVVVASLAYCVLLTPTNQPWAFFSLPTRAWELGIGGITAFVLSRRRAWLQARVTGLLGWAGVAGLAVAVFAFNANTSFPGFNAVLPVAATALVIVGGAAQSPLAPSRLLSIRPLVFIGEISYSLYLVHWPILLIAQAIAGERTILPVWATLLLAVACVPVAWVLFRFVETPFRKTRFLVAARPRRSLLLAGAASVAIVGLCGASLVVVDGQRLSSQQTASPYSATVDPTGTDFVPANLTPGLRKADADNPEVYADGCHLEFESTNSAGCQFGSGTGPTVALFGDSHAAQWFPPLAALAAEGQIQLDTNTKSSCNSVTVTSLLNNEPYPQCDEWRADVIRRLNANPPDVIILANYARVDDVSSNGESFARYWGAGLAETIAALPAASKIVVVGETATMGITPAICLSAHLTDANYCGRPPEQAIDQPILGVEKAVAEQSGASLLDLNPYLCNATWCPPIIDDTLVYRDDHHLTVAFTTALAGVFADEIDTLVSPG